MSFFKSPRSENGDTVEAGRRRVFNFPDPMKSRFVTKVKPPSPEPVVSKPTVLTEVKTPEKEPRVNGSPSKTEKPEKRKQWILGVSTTASTSPLKDLGRSQVRNCGTFPSKIPPKESETRVTVNDGTGNLYAAVTTAKSNLTKNPIPRIEPTTPPAFTHDGLFKIPSPVKAKRPKESALYTDKPFSALEDNSVAKKSKMVPPVAGAGLPASKSQPSLVNGGKRTEKMSESEAKNGWRPGFKSLWPDAPKKPEKMATNRPSFADLWPGVERKKAEARIEPSTDVGRLPERPSSREGGRERKFMKEGNSRLKSQLKFKAEHVFQHEDLDSDEDLFNKSLSQDTGTRLYDGIEPDPVSLGLVRSKSGKVRVDRREKPLYSVIKSVQPSRAKEIGAEEQAFSDEFGYICEGLGEGWDVEMRGLSLVKLAERCSQASFRVNLQGHFFTRQIYEAISSSLEPYPLALASASVIYFLSTDRVSMDLSEIVMNHLMTLLKNSQPSDNEDTELIGKIRGGIADIFKSSSSTCCSNINIDTDLTPDELAFEALMNINPREINNDWFLDILLQSGGIDQMLTKLFSLAQTLSSFNIICDNKNISLNKLNKFSTGASKVWRCLGLFELLLSTDKGEPLRQCFVRRTDVCGEMLRVFDEFVRFFRQNPLPKEAQDWEMTDLEREIPVFYWTLRVVQGIGRVFVNLTNNCPEISEISLGNDCFPSVFNGVLALVFEVVPGLPLGEQFDVWVILFVLLTNVLQAVPMKGLRIFVETEGFDVIERLVGMFEQRYEGVVEIEREHLDEAEVETAGSNDPGDLAKILVAADKHMDDSLVSAYIAVLLGTIYLYSPVVESPNSSGGFRTQILNAIQGGSVEPLCLMVKKLKGFIQSTKPNADPKQIEAMDKIIGVLDPKDEFRLRNCDLPGIEPMSPSQRSPRPEDRTQAVEWSIHSSAERDTTRFIVLDKTD